jgi:hypothetical protein
MDESKIGLTVNNVNASYEFFMIFQSPLSHSHAHDQRHWK